MTSLEGKARVLHCYFREHPFMTPREAAGLRARFSSFAKREGYTLGKIYSEKLETAPEAFQALVRALAQGGVTVVAVMSLQHLSAIEPPATLRDQLEHFTGARVLVAGSSP